MLVVINYDVQTGTLSAKDGKYLAQAFANDVSLTSAELTSARLKTDSLTTFIELKKLGSR